MFSCFLRLFATLIVTFGGLTFVLTFSGVDVVWSAAVALGVWVSTAVAYELLVAALAAQNDRLVACEAVCSHIMVDGMPTFVGETDQTIPGDAVLALGDDVDEDA